MVTFNERPWRIASRNNQNNPPKRMWSEEQMHSDGSFDESRKGDSKLYRRSWKINPTDDRNRGSPRDLHGEQTPEESMLIRSYKPQRNI